MKSRGIELPEASKRQNIEGIEIPEASSASMTENSRTR